MGLFDRFRRPIPPVAASPQAARWDGTTVDWSTYDVPDDRLEIAQQLASSRDFGVDPATSPDHQWDIALFDDVRGLVGDDTIEALPAWLETLDGITEVEHADREIIEITGTIDRDRLAAHVVARLATTANLTYWEEQL